MALTIKILQRDCNITKKGFVKNFMKKILILTTLLLAACGGSDTNANTEIPSISVPVNPNSVSFIPNPNINVPFATAGEHVIYSRDFIYTFRNNLMQETDIFRNWMGMSEEEIDAHLDEVNENGTTRREEIKQNSIDQVIERATMIILANRNNIYYNEIELESQMNNLQMQVDAINETGEDGLLLFYEIFGITLEDYRWFERERLQGIAYLNYIGDNITLTNAEIDEYLEENRERFEQNIMARVVHILINSGDIDENGDNIFGDEEYALANELLERIRNGENPRELAAQYSKDPGTPDGFYEFPRGMMVPSFEEWSFSANAGDTGIVETSFGFHVMYSEGVTDPREVAEMSLRNSRAVEIILEQVENENLTWEIDYTLLDTLQ